jgi:predicted MFS family arabinose efflux permease
MAIAGILYAAFGLFPILAVSAICFAITAAMDLLIRIPYKKQESTGNLVQIVKSDMSLSAQFIVKEKPVLAKGTVIIFFMQMTLIPMLFVGIPVLITQNLGMGMDYVGASLSISMAGGILGGLIAGMLGARLTIKKVPIFLLLSGTVIIPIGLIFLFDTSAFFTFAIITAAATLTFAAIQIAQIQFMAFLQGETPTELIGKVMSIIVILPFIASAFGIFIYGVLFELFETLPWIVIFATVFMVIMIAAYSHKHLRNIPAASPQ